MAGVSFVLAAGAPMLAATSTWFGPFASAGILAGGALLFMRATKRGQHTILAEIEADARNAGSSIVMLVGIATGGFAALSVILYDHGIGELRGGTVEGAELANATYLYYLWHLASSVPLLEIPSTLNWELRYAFTDHVHGTLLLAYKLAVILPVLGLATYVLARVIRPFGPESEAQPRSNNRSRS